MRRFKTFAQEIHRRSIWQVLTVYLVGSWIGYQVVLSLSHGLGLPDWVPGLAVVLFIIGLPIVLATAFIQEGGPVKGGRVASDDNRLEGLEHAVPTAEAGGARVPADHAPAPAQASEPAPAAARLFTWNKAITGGVLGFALLGLGATGFMGMRTLGVGPAATLISSGVVEARDPIVLADFGNATTDDRLGEIVTAALRIDLLSSPVIELVSDGRVRETLALMRRSAADPLDGDLALEIAAREGFKAVIVGEVGAVGTGYVLTARVVSAGTRETLAGFRETAATDADLLPAIDRLSGAIRAKVGESLRSTRASQPLDQVTTSSLEALRTYSRASRIADREGGILRAVGLLEEAVALDPGFAMAHRKIGVLLSNLGVERHRMVEAITRAYEHRDRLSQRERGHAVALFHSSVTGDHLARVSAYQDLLERYPDDILARNNLAMSYNWAGDHRAAEATLQPLREAGTLGPTQYTNLLWAVWGQERYEEARSLLDDFERSYPDSFAPLYVRINADAAEGRWSDAEAGVATMHARFSTNPTALARALMDASSLAAAQGRVEAATESLEQLAALSESLGLPSAAALSLAMAAMLEAEVGRDPGKVALRIQRLLERHSMDSLDPLDRPYLMIARAWLAVDETDRAAAVLREYEGVVPEGLRGSDRETARLLNGVLASQRGRSAEAIAALEAAQPALECGVCGLPELASAHERAGDTEAAIAIYTRYLETADIRRLEVDQAALGFVLQRLAELHDGRGDVASATDYYSRFVALWEHADPELQPRVEAARRSLARLLGPG
jgi:eukaryotic-like serine/threonine-protein kinase